MRAPYAEVLIEPLGYQPEVHSFERCFERDLHLSFIDLHVKQLKSNRALAERHEAQRAQADAHELFNRQAASGEQRAPTHVECSVM